MSSPQLPAHSEGQSEILEGLHFNKNSADSGVLY